MKTLVLTQCFLKTEEQGKMLGVNLELIQRLNPDCHLLLIDNASPIPADPYCRGPWMGKYECSPDMTTMGSTHLCLRFPDSIGHFSHKFVDERDPTTARDGPGRAIMTGLRIAMNSGYDRLVYCEDDALFARPFEDGFAKMKLPVACLPRGRYGYLDWNVFWVNDLKWLEQFGFIGRYDWPTQKQGPGREGERVYEAILKDFLQVLPFKGGRGEGFINERNLAHVFPDGVDWITHVSRETYAEFLRMHGHDDLARKL